MEPMVMVMVMGRGRLEWFGNMKRRWEAEQLLSFAFHDLKFCLSSQLKAASCAWCNSEMLPSKQVNGHSFTTCLIVWGSPQSQSGEAM